MSYNNPYYDPYYNTYYDPYVIQDAYQQSIPVSQPLSQPEVSNTSVIDTSSLSETFDKYKYVIIGSICLIIIISIITLIF